jgi:hypothetical protein
LNASSANHARVTPHWGFRALGGCIDGNGRQLVSTNVAGIFFAEVHQPVDMNVTYMEGETNTEAGLVALMPRQALPT